MKIYKTYEITKKLTQTAIEFHKDGSIPLWKDNNTFNNHRIYIMYINENDIIVEIICLGKNATKYFKKYKKSEYYKASKITNINNNERNSNEAKQNSIS